MKSLFFLLPLLSGIFAFPQDTQDSNCASNCPLVNCQTEDPLKLCECINNRETLCKEICPTYQPVFVPCPRKPLPIRAADPAPATCVCEAVFCPQSWPESCYCENDAKKACYDKCGGAPPTYATCPPRTVAAREPEPAPAVCKCDNVFCPQVWPDSCYCANDAKKACYEKCGGNIPIYDTCPPRGVTARAAVPAPAPAPTAEPACVCEDVMCIQSWPDSCLCRNEANKKCYEKCGGEVPEYQDCSPLDNTPAVPRAAEPQDECKCTEIFCLQIWPEGCYCANYAKELCYKECGGEKPVLEVCPPHSTPSLTTVPLPPTVLPTPAVARRATLTNQVCGGGRGLPYPDCPAGQICITNPFDKGSCGPACDQMGICVEDKMCGGFAGFDCDKEGQVCVDDSRDDCDPEKGGSDCAGLCAWPQ